ncbi:hypothetical protein NUU61_009796 [Penicillium alfredii]|uniref:Serine protein kinase n=1 Tax=Penicillium alfredii TaxID=1506179 RepID=A0A9W9EGY7_9EURO|nr:uncharacterized protein NUU61_009796 [Penicillium alfredii]KAJ5081532.1 hypothetical protein NUU61_009796 [Penicillium alfredii]
MPTEKPYPNDEHFVFRKENTTLILDTTEKFEIGKNFNFSTTTCLVYAETVEITTDLSLPGKEIGLFCNKIIVPAPVKLDVSGKDGEVGDQKIDANGGAGHAGKDAGSVWRFVQDFPKNDLNNLEIHAWGGGGGRGGDTSALEKTGGQGGNGGKGGLIEVLVGTTSVEAILALRQVDKQPWPMKIASLVEPAVPDAVAGFFTTQQRETLVLYQSLALTLRNLDQVLHGKAKEDHSENVEGSVSQLLGQIKKSLKSVAGAPNLTQAILEDLKNAVSGLSKASDPVNGLEVEKKMAVLSPTAESQLHGVLDNIWDSVKAEKRSIQNALDPKLKNNRGGTSGMGGHSGPGLQSGPKGEKGIEGETKLKLLELNGSKGDIEVSQAYVFPEQCQMLLNKTNSQLFSQKWKSRSPAVKQYERLIRRLNVVKTLGKSGETNDSGFWTAISGFEKTLKVTRNSVGQLKSMHGQAQTRLSRLMLGQDIIGHGHNWVPRLSFDHYARTLKDDLKVLKAVEELESRYKTALKEEAGAEDVIDDGIKKMNDAAQEARTKVALLTGNNGPLSQTAEKITALTAEVKEKRQNVKDEVMRLQLICNLDLLNAFSTLTSVKKDLDSLQKLYDLYKEASSHFKDKDGELVKKEYIIEQITDCTGDLESLESALKTAKNNTVEMDDPKALKVMAKAADIDKLMEKFTTAFPEKVRSKVKGVLDAYIATVLLRNEAVVEYNSFIHLLFEALHNEEDDFQLQAMQRLNFARRAVKFWGLKEDIEKSQPGPLQTAQKLELDRANLEKAFEDTLTRYAGNVRSIWPSVDEQQGLFYDLSESERVTLTTGHEKPGSSEKVYKVYITLAPGVMPFGKGRADVRVDEVRLWLVGASVHPDGLGRQRVLVHMDHMGQDVFEDEDRHRFEFSHDMVSIPFEYDAALVKSEKDLTSRAKLSRQNALRDSWTGGRSRESSSIAAIGPFTTWRLVVRESENPGLDMSKVTSAHLEFRGANRSFKYS